MKKKNQPFLSLRGLIIYSFLFLCSISTVLGQEETECPYFNISSTDTTGVVFSLVSTDIDAVISGVIANVVVQQTYVNGGDSVIDASYIFPMSTNAAIYGMKMILNSDTINAVIKRKSEAQAIFDNADSTGLTASLLEQQRPNVFQMSLANIAPGDTLSIRMVYTELLVPTNGEYQFVFPNIVGPRFTTNGEPWVYQAINDAIPLAETELNINVKINAGMPLNAESISHPADFDYIGTTAETTVSTTPGDDFIVNYRLYGNQIETGLLLYEGENENFFLSMIQPATPDVPFESPQREYVFIMDVSGSMSGTPLEISKELITNLLNGLNINDKFNILFFAGGSATLSPNSLEATAANIDLALDMITNINAGGGTLLLPAMDVALNMQGTEGYSRTFVILTDGYVTVEKEAYEMIRENLDEANFFSFGIGSAVNREIIEGIAYVGEGEAFVVTDDVDPYETAEAFEEYIENPVLTNIEATFTGIDVYDVEPFTIPDVFAQRPIIVYGKYNGPAQGTIEITGDYASGVVSSSLDFEDYTDNIDENIALQYLWARKRIKLMSDYGIASNENDTLSIEEEVTLLGLQYSLVTEFTSFVAVDSNAVSTTGGGEIDPGDGGGGGVSDIYELTPDSPSKKSYIKVLGTIVSKNGVLKLQLEDIKTFEKGGFSLQITTANGLVVDKQPLPLNNPSDIINLSVGQLPVGVYFVSLVSENGIKDTQKFIIGQ